MTSFAGGLKSGLMISILGVAPQLSLASDINMRSGVTEMSARTQYIHHIGLWVCVVVGIIVFGAMFYSMFAHHRSRNPTPATFSDSALVEFVWTLIPVLILIGMAIPATTALRSAS